MTVQDLTAIVGALGFPVVLVFATGLFLCRSFWPWYTARQAAIDARQAAIDARQALRDEEATKANERFIAALNSLIAKMDSNHQEVLREIRAMRPRTHLEPARDR